MSDAVEPTKKQKKRWSEYTPAQRAAIAFIGTLQVVLTSFALVDLARRPARRLRGTKLFWLPALFIQPFGPIAYLVLGRKD